MLDKIVVKGARENNLKNVSFGSPKINWLSLPEFLVLANPVWLLTLFLPKVNAVMLKVSLLMLDNFWAI